MSQAKMEPNNSSEADLNSEEKSVTQLPQDVNSEFANEFANTSQLLDEEADNSPPIPSAGTNLALAFVAVILLALSSGMFYYSISSYIQGILALQYKQADATVNKIEEHFDPFGIRREVQMRFLVNGHEQFAVVGMPENRILKRGELTVLFYDPGNPTKAVLTQEIDDDTIVVVGAFGLFLFGFGFIIARNNFRKRPA